MKKCSHKYKAIPTIVDNIRFPSKKEARYYGELKLRQMAGEVNYFLMQVPFEVGAGIKYKLDFMEIWNDGSIHYVDVKGYETKEFKLKKKLVEEKYPIKIEIK